MCGIAGALSFADASRDQLLASIAPLVARMTRRGPDDEGTWSDGRCVLGFRRLSILDLSPAGHQPMATADGKYMLVFNGELYNFRALRAELEARGRTFRSTGDGEVVLVALAEWGTAALARFEGMFALGFYDVTNRTLLLARDHAGIKPLYYAITREGAVFGSQYDQLLAHPWARDIAIDRGGLGLYLRFGFLPAPHALHAGMHQVDAGAWVRIDADGRLDRGTFFDLPSWQAPSLRGGAALEALDAALAHSVKGHLESDVPVGVLLSGGIDSPLVAAEAVKHHGRMQAFTIGVDDPAMDESVDARRYASEIGLDLVEERVRAQDVVGLLDDVIAASTEPAADYSMFPMLVVSRLARKHVKVVLSGDGGDELYWGYPSRFSSAVTLARYFGWPRPARFAAIAARRWLGRGHATRDVIDYPNLGRLYQRKHTLLAEADLAAIFPALPALPPTFRDFAFDGVDADRAAQWVRWNEFRIHLARVLAKVDRASMYHSLEVRVPLLDKCVIETAWKTDWRSCLDVGARIGKLPLREALERRVGYQTTAKKGFTVPMAEWLVGPLRPLVREHLLDRDDFLGLPMRRAALAAVDRRLCEGDTSKAWGIWLLLSLAMWDRTYGTRRARSRASA
jgi:asparagine synthase (glutamine-hydrolysing)